MRLERGLVQVYTGDGKGKTSAAFGLALRAAGNGLRVHVVQFMKGQETGETRAIAAVPGVSVACFGRPALVYLAHPDLRDVALAQQAARHCLDVIASGEYDVVVLDEVNVALHYGLVALAQVLALLQARPAHVELVLTGRHAHPRVIRCADLVTKMVAIKHPFDAGVAARAGIEY